jgi:hypothetical protein
MAKKNIWLGILVIVLVFGMAVVSCDNGSTSGGNPALNGTWLVTEWFQTNPPPGKYEDHSKWPPYIYKISGSKYQIYYGDDLNEEGEFIFYEDNPSKDETWFKKNPQYNDSSYMQFDVHSFNYNGKWLDNMKGTRIGGRFYRFIDKDTLYLFEGYSSYNLTLKRQK